MQEQGGEARAVAEEVEGVLAPADTTAEERRALAKVHEVHAQTLVATSCVEARRHVQLGLAILGKGPGPEAENQRAWLWMEACTPLGIDADAVRTLDEMAAAPGLKPPVLVWIGIRTAELLKRRGDLRRARLRLEAAATVTTLDANSGRVIFHSRGRAARLAGRLTEAEALHEEACALFGPGPARLVTAEMERATCAQLRGDLERARAVLRPLHEASNVAAPAQRLWLDLDLEEGRVEPALRGLEALLDRATAAKHDKSLYETARAYVDALTRAHEAEALSPADLATADGLLAVATSTAVTIAGDEFPWYRVLFGGLQGELNALRDGGQHGDGVPLLESAWRLAVAEWPDAAPPHARALVHALLACGRIDDAGRVLDEAIPAAIAQRHLGELSRLAAARVALLVRLGEPASVVGVAIGEMRLVLDETDAPRLTADTLLELARLLPDASREPDPVKLVDEAAALYAEMPIPARQARCLEAQGDIFRARGQRKHASMRHHAALSLLSAQGLGLRIPLLRRKAGVAPPAEPRWGPPRR